jgi:ABC-type lipoprotein export system ATPase subunit
MLTGTIALSFPCRRFDVSLYAHLSFHFRAGAIGPTSGYAVVAGKDIRTEMAAIRQDVGICLQHDCLFPHLTVREHVQLFARIKGLYSTLSYDEAERQVDQSIRDVALYEKRDTFSKNLSGGMKRKLSVAIAFCGESDTLFGRVEVLSPAHVFSQLSHVLFRSIEVRGT